MDRTEMPAGERVVPMPSAAIARFMAVRSEPRPTVDDEARVEFSPSAWAGRWPRS